MTENNSNELIRRQRGYFQSGVTRSVSFRLQALDKLAGALRDFDQEIEKALYEDLGKVPMEAFMTETGMVLEEISFLKKHLKKWVKNRRVRTPIAQFPSKSFVSPEPYGTVLIMSPWNYPLQLCLSPLAGAIAAGNTAIIKPSSQSPCTAQVVKKLIDSIFPPEYVSVLILDHSESDRLLENKFDYIFFTGSQSAGAHIMEMASKHLTPVSLELGGKSPVIIDRTADLEIAARRVAFGKVLNAGQTCVAPDYVIIEKDLQDRFTELYFKNIEEFFPDNDWSDYPRIISREKYERLQGLVDEAVKAGAEAVGIKEKENLKIRPVVLKDTDFSNPVMKQEIFGPVLPVIPLENFEEGLDFIISHPKPLALYLFTRDRQFEKHVLNRVSFGGGCINDTIIHLATSEMGFGGVGESGTGTYHGKASFDTFTHYRSIVKKSVLIDLPMRYHPYNKRKINLIKKFMG
ncbi:MAG: aldehyde dehydrogenase [Sphaerochaetaceae bacterium]|nr:aldehyde dehydrogenase [Sphaerochaetaceae bacterium]